jgi:hypothetical protein
MARMKLAYRGTFGGFSNIGDIVTADGQQWICKRATSLPPPDPEFWQAVAIRDPAFADGHGPKGEPGRDGRDGKDGRDGQSIPGRDGSGFTFRGTWKRRTTYSVNDVVEWEGSTYVATASTRSEPGTSGDWSLMAAKGVDGRDGEDGIGQRGRRGADGQTIVIENQSTLNLIAAESVSPGMVVRLVTGGDAIVRASSLGWFPSANVIGLVTAAAIADQPCKVAYDRLTLNDWSAALQDGGEKLTAGRNYYVSKVLGKLVDGGDDTGQLISVGIAATETTLLINVEGIIQWNKPVLATITSAGGKGMFVRPAESGHIDLALAGSDYPIYTVIGYLTDDFGSGVEASVNINGGCLDLPDWSGVTEDASSTLVEDDVYYLSQSTPGKITNVEPAHPIQLGTADSSTTLNVIIGKASFSMNAVPHCG